MPTVNQTSLVSGLSLGRLRLIIYGVVILAAVALWLSPRWFLVPPSESNKEVAIPAVNTAALKTLAKDLEAWRGLLQDTRLDDLQAPLELSPIQPGNPSPFLREVTPASNPALNQ